jgi:seryl-tRNA synthetase
MLDIKWIRDNPDALGRALRDRGWLPDEALLGKLGDRSDGVAGAIDGAGDPDEKRRAFVAAVLEVDHERRDLIQKAETAQQKRNAASAEIGKAKAKKDEARAAELMAQVADLKGVLQKAEEQRKAAEATLDDVLALIPNVPLEDVPVGVDERANVEYRRFGLRPALNNAKQHDELGEAMGQMDFATAAKLSGARFVVLKAGLARMARALGQFMLDLHTQQHGYTEVAPPLLVKDHVMRGTGQLPKFVDDQFLASRTITRAEMLRDALAHATLEDQAAFRRGDLDLETLVDRTLDRAPLKEDFWLIPTSEVPLTNLVREDLRNEADLPLRYTALTPCFRAEAGAAGKDTRGMMRQHQFDKVELVSITTPETSGQEHERMLACAEEVLKRLGIHYRVMILSTGDMGFAAQKTYDIEVWLPGQGTYREISSCSVCGDFQARRMQARYKPADGKGNRLVHTLNGSGVAVGRALIAVMENYQNPDGSIAVPEVLRPYMGGVDRVS